MGVFSLLYSCKKESAAPVPPGKPALTDSSGVNEPLLLQLVNAVRKSGCNCGTTAMPAVNPVAWNDLLTKAALAHSNDMVTHDYFSHTGFDNSSPGDRITLAGYHWTSYGENIAFNYPDEQAVMNAWLQSEGHCKNIMDGNFTEMGAAKVNAYWTQDFGSK